MKLIKKILKITLYVLGFAILIVQFIRPEKNASGSSNNNITTQFAVPAEVESMLKTSCYDCHSNTTTYPWYASVQPVGWWLADHIKDGKDELNFDEFASYSPRRQYKKFNEIVEQVT
ncbi:MAG: cytochrome C, partial [Bacteroidetes bacterium]